VPGYSKALTLDKDRPILGEWRLWKKAQMVCLEIIHGINNVHSVQHEDCLDGAYDNLTMAKEGLSELINASSLECRSEYCDKTYKKV
jgi:hypothetical protein